MDAPHTASDLLTKATAHLGRAADGYDVPGNVDHALRAILAAFDAHATGPVPSEIVRLTVQACLDVIEPAAEHFGETPLPSTIDFGMRSAGSLAETLQGPPGAIPPYIRELSIPAWIDGAFILLAEMDAATRWRRIRERAAAAGVAGYAPSPGPTKGSAPARTLPSGWKVYRQ